MVVATCQVSVHSGLDKQLDKLRRKEEKKQAKRAANGDGDAELDWLAGLGGFYALVEASEKGSGVIDNLVGKGDDTLLIGAALPQGSVRKVFKGYEEVRVPATPTAPLKPNEKLVWIFLSSCRSDYELCFHWQHTDAYGPMQITYSCVDYSGCQRHLS